MIRFSHTQNSWQVCVGRDRELGELWMNIDPDYARTCFDREYDLMIEGV